MKKFEKDMKNDLSMDPLSGFHVNWQTVGAMADTWEYLKNIADWFS